MYIRLLPADVLKNVLFPKFDFESLLGCYGIDNKLDEIIYNFIINNHVKFNSSVFGLCDLVFIKNYCESLSINAQEASRYLVVNRRGNITAEFLDEYFDYMSRNQFGLLVMNEKLREVDIDKIVGLLFCDGYRFNDSRSISSSERCGIITTEKLYYMRSSYPHYLQQITTGELVEIMKNINEKQHITPELLIKYADFWYYPTIHLQEHLHPALVKLYTKNKICRFNTHWSKVRHGRDHYFLLLAFGVALASGIYYICKN